MLRSLLITSLCLAIPAHAQPVRRSLDEEAGEKRVRRLPPAGALPSGGPDFRQAMLAWSQRQETVATSEVLEAPLPIRRLSSGFGVRRDPLLGEMRTHWGIDLPDPPGTPVAAAGSGVVRFAGWSTGYGNLVRIDHGAGQETRYAHLGAIAVRAGTLVRQGEVIGSVGSTGRSTGAHLHFEVRQEGTPVDPLASLNAPIGASPVHADPAPSIHWNGYGGDDTGLPQSRLR